MSVCLELLVQQNRLISKEIALLVSLKEESANENCIKFEDPTVNCQSSETVNTEGQETVGSRSGRPRPIERCLRAVKRHMERDSRCTAADVAEPVDVSRSAIYIYWATSGEQLEASRSFSQPTLRGESNAQLIWWSEL